MSNSLKPRPLDALNGAIVDKDGKPTYFFRRLLQDLATRADLTATNLGQFQSVAPVTGRAEGLGTSLQKLNSSGQLGSTDDIAADGTGSPLTGGKRGFIGLDTNSRLASSFYNNPVDVAAAPTAATVLSNDGVSTVVHVAAFTVQYSFGTRSYNSTSFDPGVFGTFFAWMDDPDFAGGALAAQWSATGTDQVANRARINLGAIKTVSGSTESGGGSTGGTTPGGSGGKGYNTA